MEILLSIKSKSDGTVRKVKHDLGRALVIGRGAEGGVLLEGLDLSREHLVLTADGTHIYVEDLSVNGTCLNGIRLRKSVKTRVRAEDSIEIPGYSLSVCVITESDEATPDSTSEVVGPVFEDPPNQALAPTKSGPLAALDPVFHFIGIVQLYGEVSGIGGNFRVAPALHLYQLMSA
jgi:predicted component of type VI protein secretion system